ncbi:MAG: DMT family transporter [Firmicutes bacterium]|nr:DMT family transporter [Bacillota bacterium]
MSGIIFSIIAGAAMSIQGVMNTRLSDKIGLYESNVIVQGSAFILSLTALLLLGKGSFRAVTGVNKLYLLGGALGIVITVTVMLSMKSLSPAMAVSVILISQLLVAAIIDAFGLMDSPQIPFTWNKYIGMALMIGGVILFKWKT